jgi:two-component system NtrC family sensor kinase
VASDEEFRIVGPDGTMRWLRSRAFAVENQQSPEPRLVGIVSDITAQKEAQTALIQAERMTTAGRLAASLAHEINNPLQAAMGCLELASEAVEGGRDPSRFLEVISEALGRASRVVVQLRSLQRRSHGEERLPIELWLLLDQVVVLTQKKCQSQGVEVVCEADEDLPVLRLMPDAIQQVLLNLVLNAVDAMPKGGQLRIEARHNQQPHGVWIRVADTGVGFPPEMREHLFEPFHSTKSGGLGLGLFISQNIVQQHGGGIEAESEEGKGTVFSIWLPVQE